MPKEKDFLNILNQRLDYKNFSQEVTIVSESKTGSNYSLYVVTDKNNITFQNVPGLGGISGKAFMGYINGDRGRPAIIGGTAKVTNTEETVDDALGDGSPGSGDPSGPGASGWADIAVDVLASFSWDVQLIATNAHGSDTETKSTYVTTL